jgi:hypothetical protein
VAHPGFDVTTDLLDGFPGNVASLGFVESFAPQILDHGALANGSPSSAAKARQVFGVGHSTDSRLKIHAVRLEPGPDAPSLSVGDQLDRGFAGGRLSR